METKDIILVIIVIVFFYFRIGPGSRLLKKKTHHFIVPPASRKDSNSILVKTQSNQYDRYILTKKTTDNYLIRGIKEYAEISENENFDINNFGIARHDDWKIIKISKSTSFYDYHNLAAWLSGFEENKEVPEITIGFSKNSTNSEKDYLFFLDPLNEYGDTLIGAFRHGEAFSIYLPESYEEYGSLTVNKNIKVSINERINYISKQGFNVLEIENLRYTDLKFIMNE